MPEGIPTAAGGHTATTNSTTDQPTLAVTQADREAAANLVVPHGRWPGFPADFRSGRADSNELTQAFARHRTNSEPRPAGDLREAAALLLKRAEAVQEISGGTVQHSDMLVAQIAVSSALATHSPAPMAGNDVDAMAVEYAGEYVMSTEGADYEPTQWERALILDALHGFIADHRLVAHPSTQEG